MFLLFPNLQFGATFKSNQLILFLIKIKQKKKRQVPFGSTVKRQSKKQKKAD